MSAGKTIAALAGAILACGASGANATSTTDVALFNSLVVNPTVIGFEGIAPVAGVSQKTQAQLNALYSNLGVTFSTGGNLQDADRHSANYPNGTPSDWLCVPCVAGSPFTMTFTNVVQPLIDAVGFTVAMATGGHFTVQVFNGATLLESGTFEANPYTSFNSFIGFYGLGPITSMTIDPVENLGLGIDNLVFGDPPAEAPAPASLLVFGAGLALFGAMRRKSARA